MPNNTPIMRMLSRMSPLRMWLNSCAMTPCNSSRSSNSSVPRVTAIAASAGVYPAANALMPLSSSSTYISGTGTPDAIAISSTTLRSRLRNGSLTFGGTSVPPISCATRPPPAERRAVLYSVAPRIKSVATTAVKPRTVGFAGLSYCPTAFSPTPTIRVTPATIRIVATT